MVLLIGAKVLNVQVPFLFKYTGKWWWWCVCGGGWGGDRAAMQLFGLFGLGGESGLLRMCVHMCAWVCAWV